MQEITPRLLEISHDVFGTEIYGDTAGNFLGHEARSFEKYSRYVNEASPAYRERCGLDQPGAVVVTEQLGGRKGPHRLELGRYPAALRESPEAEAAVIEGYLRGIWPGVDLPFEPPTVQEVKPEGPEEKGSSPKRWIINPGEITVASLAHYAQETGKYRPEHGGSPLHGSIGKAFGVINVAAGLTTVAAVRKQFVAEPAYTFIDYDTCIQKAKKTFRTELQQAEGNEEVHWSIFSSLHDLKNYLRRGTTEQVILGEVNTFSSLMPHAEIVFEGKGGWLQTDAHRGFFGSGAVVIFEKIATQSLLHLFDGNTDTDLDPARNFIARFCQNATENAATPNNERRARA